MSSISVPVAARDVRSLDRPFQIGDVSIAWPGVQAALSGYSDWAMRVIARQHGAAYSVCEVLLDQLVLSFKVRQRTRHFLHRSDDERPVGAQLMGADPVEFAEGAKRLVEAGFDVIDINFGCPVRKVLGRCRGGFHLSQPAVALEIVRRTRDAVPSQIPVTIKMRRGMDDSEESRDHFFEILDGARAAGIAAFTVHGRTVVQRYIGPSRWSFLREVKRHVGSLPIIGSGDLFSAHDCVRMLEATRIDGVSIARGAIGNPWIFSQLRALLRGQPLPPPPSLFEQRDVIARHWSLAEQLYGPQRGSIMMRKFGIKYSQLHPRHLNLRSCFARAKSGEECRVILAEHYAEDLPGRYAPPPDGTTDTDCEGEASNADACTMDVPVRTTS
jgi:nifR3 family TIM-barrel protein